MTRKDSPVKRTRRGAVWVAAVAVASMLWLACPGLLEEIPVEEMTEEEAQVAGEWLAEFYWMLIFNRDLEMQIAGAAPGPWVQPGEFWKEEAPQNYAVLVEKNQGSLAFPWLERLALALAQTAENVAAEATASAAQRADAVADSAQASGGGGKPGSGDSGSGGLPPPRRWKGTLDTVGIVALDDDTVIRAQTECENVQVLINEWGQDGDFFLFQIACSMLPNDPYTLVVYYAFVEQQLDRYRQGALQAFAEELAGIDYSGIVVTGHAGIREPASIGEERARLVSDFLISQGIPSGRIQTASFGHEEPRCSDEEEESCWAQNRRVEITAR